MATQTGAAPQIRTLFEKFPEMSQAAIARRVGCSEANVSGVLKTYLQAVSVEELQDFQQSKADIYDTLQHRILASLTEAKIAKAGLTESVTAAAILEDKARLVRGQATGINVNILMDVVEAIKAKRQ